jgi:hypothetical protein
MSTIGDSGCLKKLRDNYGPTADNADNYVGRGKGINILWRRVLVKFRSDVPGGQCQQ